VQKDEEAQAKIIERVKVARQYYNQLLTQINK
jgi:hypothetical protein